MPWQMIGMALLVVAAIPIIWRTTRGIARGDFASDIVASLAIGTAIVLQQPVPGLVIVLMQAGGEALERYAAGRASNAVRALEDAAPRVAHRIVDRMPVDTPVESVAVGDVLLVRPGEMLPCDGVVLDGDSDLDESRITGEPLARQVTAGANVRSGALNGVGALHMQATALARESLYATIVDLVRSAEGNKAPLQRLADRYAVWFTPVVLIACVLAWFVSHDASRVLAVLVVATPCPLILAAPVAIVGGINRAARQHIIIRTGAAIEQISRVNTIVFDKTGTLTVGKTRVATVRVQPPFTEDALLALAASLEQRSGHQLARTTVDAAESRKLLLSTATETTESSGRGIVGIVADRHVTLGSLSFVTERHPNAIAWFTEVASVGPGLRAYVVVDGDAAGAIEYADRIRDGLPALMARLQTLGVTKTMLVSGDDAGNVRLVALHAGISDTRSEVLPADKLNVVRDLQRKGLVVAMLGDGTNDAPALAAADVGVAMAAHGGGITAEAADIVLLADDPAGIADAIAIGKKTVRVAKESIWIGLGLSGAAIVAALLGYVTPTAGAVFQEVVDVVAILNALRAAR